MRELVAIDLPAGDEFVATLLKIWDSGNAALPLDQRIPQVARINLVASLKASKVVDKHGTTTKLAESEPVDIDDALVIATSGSTGSPKGVVHTHRSISSAINITGSRLNCSGDDHWLACISLAHVGGLSVVLRALHFKSKLTITERADRPTIDLALDSGANMASLVPAILHTVDISRFKTVLVGGSQSLDFLPPNVIATYGLTETMGGIVYNGTPLDKVDIRIGAESEIEVRCESLFRCYRNGFDPKTPDGWFATGDLGEINEGRLKVVGRKDDLINTGGYKVWPSTVEKTIRQLEAIQDVVVAGTADKKWGQAVTAWIVLQPGVDNFDLKVLRAHVRESLPDYCAPQKLYIVDRIPKSSLGKVLMTELPMIHE
ncbi:MAG: hypothetical protein EBV58_02280 [Actinobacteria bacterium]|nr:hypothetical protein [Actinomycetota bacterium]HBQ51777.1 hypothetical protein [Acidimicrobium sp.]